MRNFYLLGVLLCMLLGSYVKADVLLREGNVAPVNSTPEVVLSAPTFYGGGPLYEENETDIKFRAFQSNGVGVTEVYRSKFEEDNWVLVGTYEGSWFDVVDNDLSPRSHYQYRLRVVHGAEISAWAILNVLTSSKYYEPTVVETSSLYSDIVLTVTDNTYYDEWYDIYRVDANGSTHLQRIELLDSGQVFSIVDAIPDPAGTVTYRIEANAIVEEAVTYRFDYILQTTFPPIQLYNAEEQGETVCGSVNRLYFDIFGNYDSNMEIWRSTSESGPYSLIATLPLSTWDFTDDVAPRVNYYYKGRLTYNGLHGDFSNVVYIEGTSDWYNPGFAVAQVGSAVQIKLTDHTYMDYAYRLIREDLPVYFETVSMPDSGSVYIYNDTNVLPGQTYTYYVEATAMGNCDNWPYETIVATAHITVSNPTTLPAPTISNAEDEEVICGSLNKILFHFPDSLSGGGYVELYRSFSENGTYSLVSTIEPYAELYLDDVAPRVNYYYKARLLYEGEYSSYSNVLYIEGTSDWYNPELQLVLNGSSVDVKVIDHTYMDYAYRLIREDLPVYFQTVFMADSGSVYVYNDTNVVPGTTYTYYIEATATGGCDDWPYEDIVATQSITIPNFTIPAPTITNAEDEDVVCGSLNKILFHFPDSLSGGGYIELYRSLSESGPYSLVSTIEPYAELYLDDVAPRVNYYYKARLLYDGQYSSYSNTLYIEGTSDWYNPDFEVTLNGSAVQLKITDHSYMDYAYRLIREDLPVYFETVFMPDSGSVYIYNDTNVVPGTTYTYYLEATAMGGCNDWPYEDIVASGTVTTPLNTDYTITSFTLVDPVTDSDVGPLVNGQQITITDPHFLNIRANTDAKTKSVMFFLNNKRRSDNGGPIFTYFPEKNGDYSDGLTKQGVYVLEATPYSEKNGKGIAGETIVIEFEVLGPDADYTIKDFTLVDPVTDTDIGPLENGAVVDVSLAANIRANADPKTKAVMFFLNNKRRADNGAPIFTYFGEKNGDYSTGLVATGHYVLNATPSSDKNATGTVGETVTIEFDVVCSACTSDEARMAKVGEVSLYPNPVTTTSTLKIQTMPGNEVRIQIVDQFGNTKKSSSHQVDENGGLLYPVNASSLSKGIYLLRVDVNGSQVTKRFAVE